MDIALVHGSYHGAWCWEALRPELERLGHRTFAMDLPISEPGIGAAAYADAVEAALPDDSEPIMVGHSMGGLIIQLVAAHRPVRRLVFLAALLPTSGMSLNAQRAAEPIDGPMPASTPEWEERGEDVWMVGPTTARELFYHDVPTSLAERAIGRLRPQCYQVQSEPTPLLAWPSVESRSILCRDDRAVNAEWVRTAARDRLGTEALEIDGGHSPFLTRPRELAELIHSIA